MASSITTPKTLITKSLSKPYFSSSSSSQLPFKFHNRASASSSISCSYTPNSATVHMAALPRPDSFGRFGTYGGKYVPETLMHALTELETAFHALAHDEEFEKELNEILRDYVGRETPLYFAERLTEHYKSPNGEGPHIYLKREDLNHTGAHKINNAVGQALLAKRLARNVLLLRPEQVNMELPLPQFVLGLGYNVLFTWVPKIWIGRPSTFFGCGFLVLIEVRAVHYSRMLLQKL